MKESKRCVVVRGGNDFAGEGEARGYFPGITPDPLADLAPGITPYHYAFNSPVNFSDPSGLFPEKEKMGNPKIQDGGEVEYKSYTLAETVIVADRIFDYCSDFERRLYKMMKIEGSAIFMPLILNPRFDGTSSIWEKYETPGHLTASFGEEMGCIRLGVGENRGPTPFGGSRLGGSSGGGGQVFAQKDPSQNAEKYYQTQDPIQRANVLAVIPQQQRKESWEKISGYERANPNYEGAGISVKYEYDNGEIEYRFLSAAGFEKPFQQNPLNTSKQDKRRHDDMVAVPGFAKWTYEATYHGHTWNNEDRQFPDLVDLKAWQFDLYYIRFHVTYLTCKEVGAIRVFVWDNEQCAGFSFTYDEWYNTK